MTDMLYRVIGDEENLFGIACDTTELVNEACRRHDTGPTGAAALGRALTGAVLLAALLKDKQSVQLKFEGTGPLKKIITEAGTEGWVRGYVGNPQADVPLKNGQVDVAAGLGRAGLLTVTKDIGMKERYQGTVQLYTSEIGEDIAFYLLDSEQTPSVVALGVQLNTDGTIGAAGGFLIQTLPPIDENLIIYIEKRMREIPSITALLSSGKTGADILSTLFADIDHHPTGSTRLHYECSCTREKMEQAIISLGVEGVADLIEQEQGAEVTCEFCRHAYRFNKNELQSLLDTLKNSN